MSRRMRVKAAARNPRCRQCNRSGGSTPVVPCDVFPEAIFFPDQDAIEVGFDTATITFDIDVTSVDSFTINSVGGTPSGNISGGFVYDVPSKTATFTPAPPVTITLNTTLTATVVVNQGTSCEKTFTWSWTAQAE